MTNPDDMVREGERLIDQHNFEEAIALFKQVIEIAGPTEVNEPRGLALYLAVITREEQQFAFLNKLIDQYPDAPAPCAHKIKLVMRSQILGPDAAVSLCSKALEKFGKEHYLENRFRSMRFHAGMEAHVDTYLADDFIHLWQFYSSEKSRPRLIRTLLEISDPLMSSVFIQLLDSALFSEDIRALFHQKLEQLALLAKVFPVLNEP